MTKRRRGIHIEAKAPHHSLYLLKLRLLVFLFLVFLVQVLLLFRLREVGEDKKVVRKGKADTSKQVQNQSQSSTRSSARSAGTLTESGGMEA